MARSDDFARGYEEAVREWEEWTNPNHPASLTGAWAWPFEDDADGDAAWGYAVGVYDLSK